MLVCLVHPARESAKPGFAAEGATGPRKRSGSKDRAGTRDLWKAGGRSRVRRTDGVRRAPYLVPDPDGQAG